MDAAQVITLIIAVYAALVSSFAAWYAWWKDRPRLVLQYGHGGLSLIVIVVNVGHRPVYLTFAGHASPPGEPRLHLTPFEFIEVVKDTEWEAPGPVLLEAGEPREYRIRHKDLQERVDEGLTWIVVRTATTWHSEPLPNVAWDILERGRRLERGRQPGGA
jgi:hypothetical protein